MSPMSKSKPSTVDSSLAQCAFFFGAGGDDFLQSAGRRNNFDVFGQIPRPTNFAHGYKSPKEKPMAKKFTVKILSAN